MENSIINLDERLSALEPKDVVDATLVDDEEQEEIVNDSTEDSNEESLDENIETQEDTSAQTDPLPDTPDTGTDIKEEEVAKEEPKTYEFKDDFIKKAVEYYDMYGTLQPYLEVASKNYDELSDVEVLKLNFDKENSDLSEKTKARLFEKTLEKYNLEAYDDEDLEVGQDLLRRDATKIRKDLKEQQKQFIQSVQKQQEQEQIPQEELDKQILETRKQIEKGISGVVKNNLIKVEANGEGINYQIADTNKVVDYALNSSDFLSTFSKDGNVDWDKWTKVVAFAENPTQFINELIKHGKSLGRKAMEAELKNAVPLSTSKDVIETNEFVSPQDNPVEFLKGMVVKK